MSFWSLPRYISAEEHEYTDLIVSGICLIIVSVRPCSKNKITAAIKIEGKPQALNGLCCESVKLWINLAYNFERVCPLNLQLLKCFYLFISQQLQTLYHYKRQAGRKTICYCFVDEIIKWTNQMIRKKHQGWTAEPLQRKSNHEDHEDHADHKEHDDHNGHKSNHIKKSYVHTLLTFLFSF